MKPVAVIGAGSWGTALAQLIAAKGTPVHLWARRGEVARVINEAHRNPDYLSSCELSPLLVATDSLEECLVDVSSALVVTPSQTLRAMAQALKRAHPEPLPLLICSKGIEACSGLLSTEVVAEELGSSWPVAVLSGPNHAEEIVTGLPAASVIASATPSVAESFSLSLASECLRTYVSNDIVGVQLCGAFKNVVALAVGGSYGLGFGDNTAAVLITRGLAEMSRLVVALGGSALTAMGLAGAGDVVVTCMSRHSRNRLFGEQYLVKGLSVKDFEHDRHMVVEGALACRPLVALASKYGVDVPIAQVVKGLLEHRLTADEAKNALIDRPLTEEFHDL